MAYGVLVLVVVICWVSTADGLSCWYCLADNCQMPPVSNYKASTRVCEQDEQCQMTIQDFIPDNGTSAIRSVVRSCSLGGCNEVNDFDNCTNALMYHTGCQKVLCCKDKDLCNDARHPVLSAALLLSAILLTVYYLFGCTPSSPCP